MENFTGVAAFALPNWRSHNRSKLSKLREREGEKNVLLPWCCFFLRPVFHRVSRILPRRENEKEGGEERISEELPRVLANCVPRKFRPRSRESQLRAAMYVGIYIYMYKTFCTLLRRTRELLLHARMCVYMSMHAALYGKKIVLESRAITAVIAREESTRLVVFPGKRRLSVNRVKGIIFF